MAMTIAQALRQAAEMADRGVPARIVIYEHQEPYVRTTLEEYYGLWCLWDLADDHRWAVIAFLLAAEVVEDDEKREEHRPYLDHDGPPEDFADDPRWSAPK